MFSTKELLTQAIKLLSDSPCGGRLTLDGIPYKDMKPLLEEFGWYQYVVGSQGTITVSNNLIENEHGVHVGAVCLVAAEKAQMKDGWILPDGSPFSE